MKKAKVKVCKYSLCGLPFTPVRMGQKTCLNAGDGYECSRGYAKELLAEKAEKEKNEIVNAYRANVKKLPEYKADLQDSINKIVRLIDKGHPCISSGLPNHDPDAGHLISRGADDTLRFHLFNIWSQSSSENTFNGGNSNGMRENIKKLFGLEFYQQEIETLKARFPSIHMSKADCIEAKIVANKIIRELEAENRIYTTEERITLRRRINERLNIYQDHKQNVGTPIFEVVNNNIRK